MSHSLDLLVRWAQSAQSLRGHPVAVAHSLPRGSHRTPAAASTTLFDLGLLDHRGTGTEHRSLRLDERRTIHNMHM